ncbi:MAG TPA: CoA transferase [Acidimicrobiales bacterium]|nr:CoA transferase [Acidimicrobiales bacterium]
MRLADEVLVDAGVPDDTMAVALRVARAASADLQRIAGPSVHVAVEPSLVAATILLPAVLAARDGAEWPRPAPPRPAPGHGFVAADLGAPGNEEEYLRMLSTLPGDASALEVEAVAQEWRLPVVAYRRRRDPARTPPTGHPPAATTAAPHRGEPLLPLLGIRVVDLTAMWAGPLATWLLAALGADVTKVEGSVRPDGMRGQPAMFAALDRGKRHVDLDLRTADGLASLENLVAGADVVVDSFSPRVMPNLGLCVTRLRKLNPQVLAVSLPAFAPRTREADWVAYGTGVHAFSGLGDTGAGRFASPQVTYPDPLAGLTAFASIVRHLASGARARITASISDALRPLLRSGRAPSTSLLRPVHPLAAALAEDLAERRLLDEHGVDPPFVIAPR